MQFSQSYNFQFTEGKRYSVGEAEITANAEYGTIEVRWDEAEILRAGKLCKFTSKNSDEEYIGLVINPWFEGAYGIPSFTCSVVYNIKNETVSFRDQTFRFRNVVIKEAENPEKMVEAFNEILGSKYNRKYYHTLGTVKLLSPRAKKEESYWYIGCGNGVFSVREAVEEHSDVDNSRYNLENYFVTEADAYDRLSNLMTVYL